MSEGQWGSHAVRDSVEETKISCLHLPAHPPISPLPLGKGGRKKIFCCGEGTKKELSAEREKRQKSFLRERGKKLSQGGNGCKAFSLEGAKNFCGKREKINSCGGARACRSWFVLRVKLRTLIDGITGV